MISINFHGPYSEDLANAGAFDLDMQGYELIVVGKGVTKAQAANDAVAAARNLDGERQPNLAERNDDDLHQTPAALGVTVIPLAALSSTASALAKVSSPSASVTTCESGEPPSRSRKRSSCTRSGSRRASA